LHVNRGAVNVRELAFIEARTYIASNGKPH